MHPSTVIGIVGLAVLYEYGAEARWSPRARHRTARSRRPARLLFHGALVIMFFSLNGWLHDLSDSYLFSAHMVQHLMLAFVVAPLMIMGVTGDMLRPLLALPRRAAASPMGHRADALLRDLQRRRRGWHLPPLYNYALAHHPVHIVQHLMFLAASVLMWWPVLSPLPELPRLSYPGQMLYLFLMSIPMAIVSVYIAYSDAILYPMYASAPRVWGISPMNDQMIGGLIMWIPGGLFFYTIISVVFFRWQQRGRRRRLAGGRAGGLADGLRLSILRRLDSLSNELRIPGSADTRVGRHPTIRSRVQSAVRPSARVTTRRGTISRSRGRSLDPAPDLAPTSRSCFPRGPRMSATIPGSTHRARRARRAPLRRRRAGKGRHASVCCRSTSSAA